MLKTRVGHTGTLDPDAEGVLSICIGRATKLSKYLTAEDKSYTAEVLTGFTTDTGDMSGNIIKEYPAVKLTQEKIRKAAESFLYENCGIYEQIPPMYSAIKIGGKKLYDLARKGVEVERFPRPVKILSIRVRDFDGVSRFFIDVDCSKGTYIRSLCMDIGKKLGCGATMGALTRTRSGIFDIKSAVKLDEVKKAGKNGNVADLILPPDKVLQLPYAEILDANLSAALNGNRIPIDEVFFFHRDKKLFWLIFETRLLGIFEIKGNFFVPDVMM